MACLLFKVAHLKLQGLMLGLQLLSYLDGVRKCFLVSILFNCREFPVNVANLTAYLDYSVYRQLVSSRILVTNQIME